MWDLIDSELGKLVCLRTQINPSLDQLVYIVIPDWSSHNSCVQNGLGKGETMNKYVNELTALGRTSEPEDVAKAVSFLVRLPSSRLLATCS